MSLCDDVSVLILTYNEAPNIGPTLDALKAFPEIVVLDSGSTDGTLAIVNRYANTRIVTRAFDTHAAQWNFGLKETGLRGNWLLALDADYVLSPELVEEIGRLKPPRDVTGYRVGFHYCIFGHRLPGTLYPPVVALYRRQQATYVQEGHTQRVSLRGKVEPLLGRIDHDDRKPLARWLASQQKYAGLEAKYLLGLPRNQLRRTDRIRLLGWPAPLLVFFYTLIVKRCVLHGWAGWSYVLQRTVAETMIALEIVDRRLRSAGGKIKSRDSAAPKQEPGGLAPRAHAAANMRAETGKLPPSC